MKRKSNFIKLLSILFTIYFYYNFILNPIYEIEYGLIKSHMLRFVFEQMMWVLFIFQFTINVFEIFLINFMNNDDIDKYLETFNQTNDYDSYLFALSVSSFAFSAIVCSPIVLKIYYSSNNQLEYITIPNSINFILITSIFFIFNLLIFKIKNKR